jgi:hypothetical protein
MDSAVLQALLGGSNSWSGACTVVINGPATLHAYGADGIAGGGSKVYAPRYVTGRIAADAAALVHDGFALLLIHFPKSGKQTPDEAPRPVLTIVDPQQVIAVEFHDGDALAAFGMHPPTPPRPSGFIPRPNLNQPKPPADSRVAEIVRLESLTYGKLHFLTRRPTIPEPRPRRPVLSSPPTP